MPWGYRCAMYMHAGRPNATRAEVARAAYAAGLFMFDRPAGGLTYAAAMAEDAEDMPVSSPVIPSQFPPAHPTTTAVQLVPILPGPSASPPPTGASKLFVNHCVMRIRDHSSHSLWARVCSCSSTQSVPSDVAASGW